MRSTKRHLRALEYTVAYYAAFKRHRGVLEVVTIHFGILRDIIGHLEIMKGFKKSLGALKSIRMHCNILWGIIGHLEIIIDFRSTGGYYRVLECILV